MGIDLSTAYALTLVNPWAELVARYGKSVENRTWLPWPSLDLLLIHAGKAWDAQARGYYHGNGQLGDVPTSAIVAVARVSGACTASRYRVELECDCDPLWAQPLQIHWRLTDVVPLTEPVPGGGKQGLWRPDSGTLLDVAERYRPDQAPAPLPLPPTGVMPEPPGEVVRTAAKTVPGDCPVCGAQEVEVDGDRVAIHHPVRIRGIRDDRGRTHPQQVRVMDVWCDGAGERPEYRGGRPRKAAA